MTRVRPPKPLEISAAARDPRFLRALKADPNGDWREQGLCRDLDPETFFPLPNEPTDDAIYACGRCPVQTQCLAEALQGNQLEGIWGGTTPAERRGMVVAWRQRTSSAGFTS